MKDESIDEMIKQLNEDRIHGSSSSITLGEVVDMLSIHSNDNDVQETLIDTVMNYLTSE